MKQRTISFLLAIVMVLGTLTGYAPVFAEAETQEYLVCVDVNAIDPEFNHKMMAGDYLEAVEISNKALDTFKGEIEALIGKKEEKERLNLLLPGLVYDLSQEEKAAILGLPNVEGVYENESIESPKAYEGRGNVAIRSVDDESNKASLKMIGSHDLIGQDEGLMATYDGTGRVLAVIDSGMDPNHRAFYLSPGTPPTLTPGDIRKLQLVKGINVRTDSTDLYRSEKVPFAYNYAQNIADINPVQEVAAHGQHVSGTVAGNHVNTLGKTWSGVAPNAQLLMMNVFGKTSGTSATTYIRAMEDAITLGADAANMSIGSTKGLNQDRSIVAKAVDRGYMTNTNFVIAAGNEGEYQGNLSIENPDFGTVGSPGVITNAITVASLENRTTVGYEFKFNGLPVAFSKSGNIDLVKGRYEFVECGLGQEADFEGKDLSGKYALIKRGDLTFIQKILNAQAKGAVGVVIYNNVEGGLGLAIDDPKISIPAFAVKKEIGELMLSASEKIIEIDPDEKVMDNPEFGEISAFSNWGLSIGGYMKPDITAPGGNIYSTQTMGDTFGLMSGTSMATPHVTGAVGVLRQKIDQDPKFGYVKDRARLVKVLMMNSAVPHKDPVTGQATSPRRQGAGILNLDRALQQDFTVVDSTTKIPSKFVGNVEDEIVLNLTVNNYSEESKTFTPSVAVTIDAKDGKKLMLRPDELFSKTYDDQAFTVGAGQEKTVTITMPIEHMEKVADFTNGAFVEGFLNLSDQNGKTANFSFVSFKGEYESLPSLEKPIYDFDFETEYPMYWNFEPKEFAWFAFNTAILTSQGMGTTPDGKKVPYTVIAGIENYSEVNKAKNDKNVKDKETIKPKFEPIVISPNSDGYNDNVSLQAIAVRDAQIRLSIENEDGEEEYYTLKTVQKNNSYWPDKNKYGLVGFSSFGTIPVTRLEDGKYTLKLAAKAYINGAYTGPETFREIKFSIDRKGPSFYDSNYDEESRTVSFKAKDESFVRKVVYKVGEEKTELEAKDGVYSFVIPEGKELSEVLILGLDGGFNKSEISVAAIVHGDKYGTLTVNTEIDKPEQALDLVYKVYDKNGQETKSKTNLELGKYTLKVESYNPAYELLGEEEIAFELTKENKDKTITLQFKKIPSAKLSIKISEKLDLKNEDIKVYATNQKSKKTYELKNDPTASEFMRDYYEAFLPYGSYKLDFKFTKEGYDVSLRSYDGVTYPEAFELNDSSYTTAYVDIVRKVGYNPVKLHFETKGIDQEVEYIAIDLDKASQENPDQLGQGRFVILPKEVPAGYYVKPSKYDLEISGTEEIEKTYTFEYFEIGDTEFSLSISDNYEEATYYIEDIYSYYGLGGKSFETKKKELSLKPGRYYVTALADDEAYGEETTYNTGGPVFIIDAVDQAQEVSYKWTKYADTDKTGTAIVMVVDDDSILPNEYEIEFMSSSGEKTKIKYNANDFTAIVTGHQFKYGAYTVEIPALPEGYTVEPSKFYLTSEEGSFFMKVVKKNQENLVNVNFQFMFEGEKVEPVQFKLTQDGEVLSNGYNQVEIGEYELKIEHLPIGYALVNDPQEVRIDKETKEILIDLKKIQDEKVSVKGSYMNYANAPENSIEIIASANGEEHKALITQRGYEFALEKGQYKLTVRSTNPAYQPEFTEMGDLVLSEDDGQEKILDRKYNITVRKAYEIKVDTVFDDNSNHQVTYRVETIDILNENKKGTFDLSSVPGYGNPRIYVENIPEGYTVDKEMKTSRFSTSLGAFDPVTFTFSKKSDQPASIGKLKVNTEIISGRLPRFPEWRVVGEFERHDIKKVAELPFGDYEIEMVKGPFDTFKTVPETIKVSLTKENPEQTVTFKIYDKNDPTDTVNNAEEEGTITVEVYNVDGDRETKKYYAPFYLDGEIKKELGEKISVKFGQHTVKLDEYWNILDDYDEEKSEIEKTVNVDATNKDITVVLKCFIKEKTPEIPQDKGILTWKVNYEEEPSYKFESVTLYKIEGETENKVSLDPDGSKNGGPIELEYGKYKLELNKFYDNNLVIKNNFIEFELTEENKAYEAVFEVGMKKENHRVNMGGLKQDLNNLTVRVYDILHDKEIDGVRKVEKGIEFPAINMREYKIEIEGADYPYTPNVIKVFSGIERTINFAPELNLTIKSMAGDQEIYPEYRIEQGNQNAYFTGEYGDRIPAITGIGTYYVYVTNVPQGYELDDSELGEGNSKTFTLGEDEYDKTISFSYRRNSEQIIDTSLLRELIKQADEIRTSKAYMDADQEKKDAYEAEIEKAKNLLKNNYTEEDVEKAVSEIIRSRDAIVGDMLTMLKEDLKVLLDEEESIKSKPEYIFETDENKRAYDQAIENGKTLYSSTNADEAEIRRAIKEIEDAKLALRGFEKADKEELSRLIREEKTVVKTVKYLEAREEEKDNYLKAIARGVTVEEDDRASDSDVAEAIRRIKDAYDALSGVEPSERTERPEVEEVYENDRQILGRTGAGFTIYASVNGREYYTQADANGEFAVPVAKIGKDDKVKVQAKEDQKARSEEVEILIKELDIRELEELVRDYDRVIELDEYKNSSNFLKTAYDKAIKMAKYLLESETITHKDKEEKVEAIKNYLQMMGIKSTLDKTALEEAIRLAKEFKETDSFILADEEERRNYEGLIEKAENIYENSQNEDEVLQVIEELRIARENFKTIHTVSFDPANGEDIIRVKVRDGDKVQQPKQPKKAGYRFTAWTLEGRAFDFKQAIKADITLKAMYEKEQEKPSDPTYPDEPIKPDYPIYPEKPYKPEKPNKPERPKDDRTEKKGDKKDENKSKGDKKDYGLIDFEDFAEFVLDDVSQEHLPAVISLVKKGILKGMDNNKFEGQLPINRAMVVEILRRISKDKDFDQTVEIVDVKVGDWYYESIMWARERGILEGYLDGSMRPNQLVTKQELAVIIARFLEEMGIRPVEYNTADNVGLELLPEWSRTSVEKLVKIGFINWTKKDSENLESSFTRYELAEIINKIVNWVMAN